MQFHFQSNEGEEGVTRPLPGYDLHGLGSSFEFLIKSLDDVRCPERNPFFLREIKESKAGLKGLLQALYRRRDLDLPFGLEFSEELSRFLPGGCIEDGAHPVGNRLLEFLRHLGQYVSGDMDLAALNLGLGELFDENLPPGRAGRP